MFSKLLRDAAHELGVDRRTTIFDVRIEFDKGSARLKGEVQDQALKERLIRYMSKKTDIKFIDGLTTLPHSLPGKDARGVASVSVANLYVEPDLRATITTQALLGTPLSIIARKGGWSYVQMPDGYLGWMTETLARMTLDEFETWANSPKVIVTDDHAVCYESTKGSALPISDLVAGDILAMTGGADRSIEVRFPDGRNGYLAKDAAKPLGEWTANAAATPESVLAAAQRFRGVPYMWGGTSPKAFDCSGYVKAVYFLCGILLPRDADQQYSVGSAVKKNERLQPGELLFFCDKAPAHTTDPITHVGISLGGKRFLEASGYVLESSLDPADSDYSEKRATTFIGAKRIIGADVKSGVRFLRDMSYYRDVDRGQKSAVSSQ
jgi:hypothetical protein